MDLERSTIVDTAARALATDFVELNQLITDGAAPAQARQRLVDLACTVIPGCDGAGITKWPEDRPPHSLATSSSTTEAVDAIQYETGEGPCLTAADENWTAWSPDLQTWPRFAAKAVGATRVRGVLAFHLASSSERHALNLYAHRRNALDSESVAAGTLFAAHTAVLMAHAEAAQHAQGMRAALDSSREIGIAIGMLMKSRQLTQGMAFRILRRTSNDLNRKLRDVAAEMTETGKLPSR